MSDVKSRILAARESGAVTRFHAKRVLVHETVAEHTFNLMNILMLMTEGAVSRGLLIAALTHDMGETATGDIPADVKRKMDTVVKNAVGKMEQDAVEYIHPSMREIELTEGERHLLKVADRLDGLMKCYEEVRYGNTYLIEVGNRYVSYLYELLECNNSGATFASRCIDLFQKEVLRHGSK
jgi:5'-deoxynucleotidase YfbR-like HD superfamily hydrolase